MSTKAKTYCCMKPLTFKKLWKIMFTTPISLYIIAVTFALIHFIRIDGISTITEYVFQKKHTSNKKLLPNKYQQCFKLNENVTLRQCKLPNNVMIQVQKEIGHGEIASIWLTKIYSAEHNQSLTFDNYEIYAMKYSIHCSGLYSEYKLLSRIYKHNKTKINIPSLHPSIPFYYFYRDDSDKSKENRLCFIFMQYIPNTLTLQSFSQTQTIQSFNEIDGGIIQFILTCYDDVIAVLYRIYIDLNGLHNDMHPNNVLVDMNDHKCYVIDFGNVKYLTSRNMYEKERKFDCASRVYMCSMFTATILFSNQTRHAFRNKFLWNGYTNEEIIDEFRKVGLFDMKYKIASMLLHLFLKYIIIDRSDYEYLIGLNTDILNTKQFGQHKRVLCKRFELFNHMEYMMQNMMQNGVYDAQRFLDLINLFYVDKDFNNLTIPVHAFCD